MKLYEVNFTFGDHEMEGELYAGIKGTHTEARQYLLMAYTDEQGTGYMEDVIGNPELLKIESVREFTTVHSCNGDPYNVTIKE